MTEPRANGPETSTGNRTVTIAVPAQPEVAQVVRAVVGSVASRLDLAYDEIDDLRLAASEVVAHLLEEQPPAEALIVRVTELEEGIEIVVARTTPTNEWPPTGARHSLTTLILRSLADDASFERTDEGPSIRFTKRFGSRIAPRP